MENNSSVNDEVQELHDRVNTLKGEIIEKNSFIRHLGEQTLKLTSHESTTSSTGSLQIAALDLQDCDDKVDQFLDVQQRLFNARKRQFTDSGDSLIILSKRPRTSQIDEQFNQLQINAPLSSQIGKVGKESHSHAIQLVSLQRELDEANKQVAFFFNQNADFIKLLAEYDNLRQAKWSIENELQEATEQNESLRTRVGLQKQEITGLNLSLKESKSKVADLTKQIEDASNERNQLVHDLGNEATAKFGEKDYVKSMELWLRAIGVEQAGRNDVTVLANSWGNVAVCLSHGLNRTDLALQAVEHAISLNPPNSTLYNELTAYAERLGRPADTTKISLSNARESSKLVASEHK